MKKVSLGGLLTILGLLTTPVYAAQILYDLTSLGGDQYRYTYTVTNNGSTGGAVELFDIFFDPSVYDETSLTIVTPDPPASGWDQLILGSGIALPAAYDSLSLSGGIPTLATESGFAVEFRWLSEGTPGTQDFAIYDPVTFAVLESGTTTVVPVPTALPLFAGALVSLLGIRASARGDKRNRQISGI